MDFDYYLPIVAAPVGGHGRADWGFWANSQLRDQNGEDAGEWIEMGRSSRFRYSKPDGSIGTGSAIYLGPSKIPNHGRFYVKGVDGVKDGVYDLDAGSIDPVKFYFAEGTALGEYLENYYKSIGRDINELDVPSKLPVIDFSTLTPAQPTKEDLERIKPENRVPPPRNIKDEVAKRTEAARTAGQLQVGDIVHDNSELNRYGSVEFIDRPDGEDGPVEVTIRWENNQIEQLKLDPNQELAVWSQVEELVVSEKKKKTTKKAKDLEIGDRFVVKGETFELTDIRLGMTSTVYVGVSEKDGRTEAFDFKDNANVEIAPEKTTEPVVEEATTPKPEAAPTTPSKEATSKKASELIKGDRILIGGEPHLVSEVAKDGETVVLQVSPEDGQSSFEQEFEVDEVVNLATKKSKAKAKPEPEEEATVSISKAQYEDYLKNGFPTYLFQLNAGDVLVDKNGNEALYISHTNDGQILLSNPDGTAQRVYQATVKVQTANGEIREVKVRALTQSELKLRVKQKEKAKKQAKAGTYDSRDLQAINKKSELSQQPPATPLSEEEEEEEEKPSEEVEIGDLRPAEVIDTGDGPQYIPRDFVVIDGKVYGVIEVREKENAAGEFLGLELVLDDETGKITTTKTLYQYDDKIQTADTYGTPKKAKKAKKAKVTGEEATPQAEEKEEISRPTSAAPLSSGKLDEKVTYQVLDSGRSIRFGYGIGKTTDPKRLAKVKKAIQALSKTFGIVLGPYFYQGNGTRLDRQGNSVPFSDPVSSIKASSIRKDYSVIIDGEEYTVVSTKTKNKKTTLQLKSDRTGQIIDKEFNSTDLVSHKTRAGYVLELLPGEKDSANSILTQALQAIFDELAKPDEVIETAAEGEAFSGSRNSTGALVDGVTFTVDDLGRVFFSGDIPGGIEELSDYLFELYPNGEVELDPDGMPPYVAVYPSDVGRENELRAEVLENIRKYLQSKSAAPSSTPQQQAAEREEEKEEEEQQQEEQEDVDPLQKTYDILQATSEFYENQISSPEAEAYLKKRGISVETAKSIGVGYAPKDKAALYKHLLSLGFTRQEMIAAGVIGEGDDQTAYDKFRNRIIFTFRDAENRPVGFQGRDLTNKADAKYMLSKGPDEKDPKNKSVFKKSEVILNLGNAAEAAKKSGQLIIVEGPFDLLAYREAGFENVIAISGSDIKENQVELIKNAVGEDVDIVLAYDPDQAGERATKKSYELFSNAGYTTYIANDPSSDKDPADILLESGPEALKNIILNKKRVDGSTDEQLAEFTRLVFENPEAFTDKELKELADAIANSSEETAEVILNNLREKIEIAPLKKELEDLIKQAEDNKLLLQVQKLKIEYKISTAKDKKQALIEEIEKLKKKLQGAPTPPPVTPATPAKKIEITQQQRDAINQRLSLLTEEQKNQVLEILKNPNLTKQDLRRVIKTLEMIEQVWRMDNGWPLNPKIDLILNLTPVITLNYTPMQVGERIKTYKPTRDAKGNPLPVEKSVKDRLKAAIEQLYKTASTNPADKANSLIEEMFKDLSDEDAEEFLNRVSSILRSVDDFKDATEENLDTVLQMLFDNFQKDKKERPIRDQIQNELFYRIEGLDGYKSKEVFEKANELGISIEKLLDLIKSKKSYSSLNELLEMLQNSVADQSNQTQELEDLIKQIIQKSYEGKRDDGDSALAIERAIENLKNAQIKDLEGFKKYFAEKDPKTSGEINNIIDEWKKKESATPATPATPEEPTEEQKEGQRWNAPGTPSNLGKKTGTIALPQTGDNYNSDGTPAYAPSTGPFRGFKLQVMISQAYKSGGVRGVKNLIDGLNKVGIDTETSGMSDYDGQLQPSNRLVQIGASRVNKDGKVETFNIYVNPGTGVVMSDWSKENLLRPELDENGNPTGNFVKIEKDWLEQQADEREALIKFIEFLGDDVVLVGHNLNFDISVIQEALDRHGLFINALGSIDTMDFSGYSLPTYNPTGKTKSGKPSRDGVVLDGPRRPVSSIKPEDLDPNNPEHFEASKRLGDVLQYFGLEPTGWHRADADALDSMRILDHIFDWLIADPKKESTNPIGLKALDFEKINQEADRQLSKYLNAIGSGRPATARQTEFNPVDKKGRPLPSFSLDLTKMGVSEEVIKKILGQMGGMTRGQASEYIASILSDLRAGNEPDIEKALKSSGFSKPSSTRSNTIPDAQPQDSGTPVNEIAKRAADLDVGDRVRLDGTDTYGIVKSIDKSTAGIVKITIAYDNGESVDMSVKPSKMIAVYQEDGPKDSVTPDPQTEQDTPSATPTPNEDPTSVPAPEPAEEPKEEEAAQKEGEEPKEEKVVVDVSDYPVQDREGIKEFLEILDELNRLEGKESKIKVIESGKPDGLTSRTPKFIEAFDSKEDIEKTLIDLGISKFKAKRIAKKLQSLEGKEGYLAELRKINQQLDKEQRNKKSFKDLEGVMDFNEFLRLRGYSEPIDFGAFADPIEKEMWRREQQIYWAWRKSIRRRGKVKTISDGNISVRFTSGDAQHAQRLLDNAKKLQEKFPLDGRKLIIGAYSPEQLAVLDIGDLVGASIVTDKSASIAISSESLGKKEQDPRLGKSKKKDLSDVFTLIHEYGHVYDEIALNGKTREKFVNQFKNSTITEYAEENMSERFAEHFMDLAYSEITGTKPVSTEFKNFIQQEQENGNIDPRSLKPKGPFFGDEIVSPRRVSAIVQGSEIRGLSEKVDKELQDFEGSSNTGNGKNGAWLLATDEEAGYIPDLSKLDVAKRYIRDIFGISSEKFDSFNEETQNRILRDIRAKLQPLIDEQRKDKRKYRVFTVQGTNIHIRYKDGNPDITPEILSNLARELKYLDNFVDMHGMPVIVTLAENNTFSVAGKLFEDGDSGINVFNSDGTQMHVVLNTKYATTPFEPEAGDKFRFAERSTVMIETLIHEYLGHGLSKIYLGERIKNSEQENERFIEFKKKFPLPANPKDHPVSEYAATNHSESFAEYTMAAYALIRAGANIDDYPEIAEFLNFVNSIVKNKGPVRRTNQDGLNLAIISNKKSSQKPSFPQRVKNSGEIASIDTFNDREAHYSSNLDPYGNLVHKDFIEILESAYGLVVKARKEYVKNPTNANFYKYAALAATINEIYDSRYFNYPRSNPKYTVESILDNITTSNDASSMRRWQSDKPFVALRYPTSATKFNNELSVSSFTDENGDIYQIAHVSSRPANTDDDISESAQIFISNPNEPLSEFINFGTSFMDLAGKSAGQLKVSNFEKGHPLEKDELEIRGAYVQPKSRRRGLATAMLAVAKQNSRKNLKFSENQTILEDSWARSVDQNPENHLAPAKFTDPSNGLRPANLSRIASNLINRRKSDADESVISDKNSNSNVRNQEEEEAFDAVTDRYLSTSAFAGRRGYQSADGGGLGADRSVVGAVRTETLSSMAGNEVDESRVLEIMEKIQTGRGFIDPVVVYYDPETKDMVVADGNHHVEAAKRLGIDFIPTRVISGKFNSNEFLSVKKATREWKEHPFKSEAWPRNLNPYFIFDNNDLISVKDDDVIVSNRKIKRAVGIIEPDDIAKLMGRYVVDSVTGQIYMVLDEHIENGQPTGRIIVERLQHTFDEGKSAYESRVNGKLTFNSEGLLYRTKGKPSLNGEYNDIRQYVLEIRDVKDFTDVTESFVKSGGQPLVITESMYFQWRGMDVKGRINRFISPGVVELIQLVGVDSKTGENQYKTHTVPVSELLPIQLQRETLSSEAVDHSEDMLADKDDYGVVISIAKQLLADGFIDFFYFTAILKVVDGKFQTKSGVRDMIESLIRLDNRRIRLKEEEDLPERLRTTTTRRGQLQDANKQQKQEAQTLSEPVVKGRMTFRQLYDQVLEDKKNGVVRDPFTDTTSPATESGQNPISEPEPDVIFEIANILGELALIDESLEYSYTKEESLAIMEALKFNTREGAREVLDTLRVQLIRKRMDFGEPIEKLSLPKKYADSEDRKAELRKYTPKVNLDGTPYTGKAGSILKDDVLHGEKEEIIDYIRFVLQGGDFLHIYGGAGTGKSTIIRELIQKYTDVNMAVIAPTGTAAIQVGPGAASTIHSFFGFEKGITTSGRFEIPAEEEDDNGNTIMVRYSSREEFIAKYSKSKKGKALAKLQVLVIDEVSMVNAALMDAMDLALRVAKGKMGIPFGGVKVVAFGDDNQLPPVEEWNPQSKKMTRLNADYANKKIDKEDYDRAMRVELEKKARHEDMLLNYKSYRWFDSSVFAQQKPLHYGLTKIWRQENKEFAEILTRFANAFEINSEDLAKINERYGKVPDDEDALRLVLKTDRADAINAEAIGRLKNSGADSQEFVGTFKNVTNPEADPRAAFRDDDLFAKEITTLYVGERVIFTVNDGKDLQEQARYRGNKRWSNGTQGVVVGFDDETGLPVVEIQVKNPDGTKSPIQVVVGYATSTAKGASSETVFDEIAGTPTEKFVAATEAEFTQVPLLPAYAITTHKAQGMTISGQGIIDFLDEDGKPILAFASGQTYVALSRFTDLDNIFLTRKLTPADFISDIRVEEYYSEIENIDISGPVEDKRKERQREIQEAEQTAAPETSESPENNEPVISEKRVFDEDSGKEFETIYISEFVDQEGVEIARDIINYKTRPASGMPSNWGTDDLISVVMGDFGYTDEDLYRNDLEAIKTKNVEDLSLEQKLLVALINQHGKADVYTDARTGSVIKRFIYEEVEKNISDEQVNYVAESHNFINDSGYVINNGFMDIELRYERSKDSEVLGDYSPTSDKIRIYTSSHKFYYTRLQEKAKNDKSYIAPPEDFLYLHTLAHEYGHYLDHEVENWYKNRPESEPTFASYIADLIKAGMKNRAKTILHEHALETSSEYVAESYAGWLLKDILKDRGHSEEAIFDATVIEKLLDKIEKRNNRKPGDKMTSSFIDSRTKARKAMEEYEKDNKIMWERVDSGEKLDIRKIRFEGK